MTQREEARRPPADLLTAVTGVAGCKVGTSVAADAEALCDSRAGNAAKYTGEPACRRHYGMCQHSWLHYRLFKLPKVDMTLASLAASEGMLPILSDVPVTGAHACPKVEHAFGLPQLSCFLLQRLQTAGRSNRVSCLQQGAGHAEPCLSIRLEK